MCEFIRSGEWKKEKTKADDDERSESIAAEEERLSKVNLEKNWIYVDYQYLNNVFTSNEKELLDYEKRWTECGLPFLPENSAIWIGTKGACSPCHYDSYGVNIVAQLLGRKRWYLIHPRFTSKMYPTRIPYEESTVYSQIPFPWITKERLSNPEEEDEEVGGVFATADEHRPVNKKRKVAPPPIDRFDELTARFPLFYSDVIDSMIVVDLEPGQMLFVPRHWWHFVECLETSITINQWFEHPKDDHSRRTEALTKWLVYSLLDPAVETTMEVENKDKNEKEKVGDIAPDMVKAYRAAKWNEHLDILLQTFGFQDEDSTNDNVEEDGHTTKKKNKAEFAQSIVNMLCVPSHLAELVTKLDSQLKKKKKSVK